MDTVVRTSQGAVRGRTVEGVAIFKGIPYAAPPSGAYRFRLPQPTEPWDGVRDALNLGGPALKGWHVPIRWLARHGAACGSNARRVKGLAGLANNVARSDKGKSRRRVPRSCGPSW